MVSVAGFISSDSFQCVRYAQVVFVPAIYLARIVFALFPGANVIYRFDWRDGYDTVAFQSGVGCVHDGLCDLGCTVLADKYIHTQVGDHPVGCVKIGVFTVALHLGNTDTGNADCL